MDRILPWLALIIAAGVAIVAVVELNNRSEDSLRALPTTVPSPSLIASPLATPELTTPKPTKKAAQATTAPTATIAHTQAAPAPIETRAPAPTPTVAPPETPSPEPALTAGPIDKSKGSHPPTGGGAWPNGPIIAIAALGLRWLVMRPRRTA